MTLKIFPGIFSAYRSLFSKLAVFILFIGAVGAVSLLVALPLWYFASSNTQGFSIFALTLLCGLGLFGIIRKSVSSRSEQPRGRRLFRNALKFILGIAFLIGLYGIVLLFSRNMTGWAIPAVIAFVLLFGLYLYGFFSIQRQ